MQKIKSILNKVKKYLAEKFPAKSQRKVWSAFYLVLGVLIIIFGALILYSVRSHEKELTAETQLLRKNFNLHIGPAFLERIKHRKGSQETASKKE